MTKQEARNTLKSLKDYYNDKNEDSYVGFDNEDNEAFDMAIQALEQQTRTGHWEEHDTTFGRNIYYCTACGRSLEILYKYDFCPLCGADMREVEE